MVGCRSRQGRSDVTPGEGLNVSSTDFSSSASHGSSRILPRRSGKGYTLRKMSLYGGSSFRDMQLPVGYRAISGVFFFFFLLFDFCYRA